ncbi:NAD(P)/FAD-dependent oxidoreductase [Pannonibacter carbonis]|uniref:NAD(P)/FAD-dependent oxidoreductase n=1 Tax=Pannonibacter carbonis TaxID=2067569 RepID=UPI001FCAFAC8|nr:TIGR03862 family flavoprotein [Pannonibacter carbonis]
MPQDAMLSAAAAEPVDALIIGAGPAGLIAADHLSAAGHAVTIVDRMPSPARKFLLAGRGGLNLTHSEPIDAFMTRYGLAAAHLEPAIRAFDPEALQAYAAGLGQETFIGSSGRVFPKAMKASPMLRALLARLGARGVRLVSRAAWAGFAAPGASRFHHPDGGETVIAARVTLLALGGASWPRLGGTGDWLAPLAAEGVETQPLRPSNCGFVVPWSAMFADKFAGTPLKRIAVRHGTMSLRGEAMLSRTGIEGGAIYALSSALRDTLERDGSATLYIDLRPDVDTTTLAAKLDRPQGKQSRSTFLRKALGLAPVEIALLRECAADAVSPADIAARIKALPITATATAGMERAISSAGGVDWSALGADFSLTARPDVFVAGEMIDWEAPTGGYLLQACFATGLAAARGMDARLKSGEAEA